METASAEETTSQSQDGESISACRYAVQINVFLSNLVVRLIFMIVHSSSKENLLGICSILLGKGVATSTCVMRRE
jgi:hypothetical protein